MSLSDLLDYEVLFWIGLAATYLIGYFLTKEFFELWSGRRGADLGDAAVIFLLSPLWVPFILLAVGVDYVLGWLGHLLFFWWE